MDQHLLRREVGEGGKAQAHRILAGRTAVGGRPEIEPRGSRVVEVPVVRMDHCLDGGNRGMGCKGLEGVAQHRFAGEGEELLRHLGAEAMTAAGGNHQGSGFGHGLSLGFMATVARRIPGRP